MENFEKDDAITIDEGKYHELFTQRKWWDALNYAREKKLPFDKDRILTALNAIRMAQHAAEARGDQTEVDRLQFEYDRIDLLATKDQ